MGLTLSPNLAQPVVQPLIVSVIEPLLLEVPLNVPIHLGDEKKLRMRPNWRNHNLPILRAGP